MSLPAREGRHQAHSGHTGAGCGQARELIEVERRAEVGVAIQVDGIPHAVDAHPPAQHVLEVAGTLSELATTAAHDPAIARSAREVIARRLT